jgi:hypothetical protein
MADLALARAPCGRGGWSGSLYRGRCSRSGSDGGSATRCCSNSGCGSWVVATHSTWTLAFFGLIFNGISTRWTSVVHLTLEDWTSSFLVRSIAKELLANWALWSWSWLTNGRLTSALVDTLDDHLAWSARGDLDSWAESVDTRLLSWATTFGALDETHGLFNLALVTLWLLDLWTVEFILIAALAWQAFAGLARVASVNSCFLNGEEFAFLASQIAAALDWLRNGLAKSETDLASELVTANVPRLVWSVGLARLWINAVCTKSSGGSARCAAFNLWTFAFFDDNSRLTLGAFVIWTRALKDWTTFLIFTKLLRHGTASWAFKFDWLARQCWATANVLLLYESLAAWLALEVLSEWWPTEISNVPLGHTAALVGQVSSLFKCRSNEFLTHWLVLWAFDVHAWLVIWTANLARNTLVAISFATFATRSLGHEKLSLRAGWWSLICVASSGRRDRTFAVVTATLLGVTLVGTSPLLVMGVLDVVFETEGWTLSSGNSSGDIWS